MKARYLCSKDVPLAEFVLKPGGRGVEVRHLFEEHKALMPHVLQGGNADGLLSRWLWHRFSPAGRWLLRALQKSGMPQDFPAVLETTCALSLTDALWVHDGSKSWAQENLFDNVPPGRSA